MVNILMQKNIIYNR